MSRSVTFIGLREVVLRDCMGGPLVALWTSRGRVGLITGQGRDEVEFSPAAARALAARLIAHAEKAREQQRGEAASDG